MGFSDVFVKTAIQLFGPHHGPIARVVGSLKHEFAFIPHICISVGCSRDFVGAVIDDLVRVRMITRSGNFITKPRVGKTLFKALKQHGLVKGSWSENFWKRSAARQRQTSIQTHWSFTTSTRRAATKNKRNNRAMKRVGNDIAG